VSVTFQPDHKKAVDYDMIFYHVSVGVHFCLPASGAKVYANVHASGCMLEAI
jgi:hypothetical protein